MIPDEAITPLGLILFMVSVTFAFHMITRPTKSVPSIESPVALRETETILNDEDTMDTYVQEVLPLQERQFPELARRLRETAQRLAAGGTIITSDDIHEVHPIPQGIDPRIMATAFTPRKLWRKVGYTPSMRKENHSRPIARWQLKDAA